jgi:hypothetical protein
LLRVTPSDDTIQKDFWIVLLTLETALLSIRAAMEGAGGKVPAEYRLAEKYQPVERFIHSETGEAKSV